MHILVTHSFFSDCSMEISINNQKTLKTCTYCGERFLIYYIPADETSDF